MNNVEHRNGRTSMGVSPLTHLALSDKRPPWQAINQNPEAGPSSQAHQMSVVTTPRRYSGTLAWKGLSTWQIRYVSHRDEERRWRMNCLIGKRDEEVEKGSGGFRLKWMSSF